jgi:hypothetical protein
MNVTRGLFRLWIVVSVLWAVGMGGSTWWTYPEPAGIVSEAAVLKKLLDEPTNKSGEAADVTADVLKDFVANYYREEGRMWGSDRVVSNEEFRDAQIKYWREALSSAALIGIVPPIAVLIIGASLVWAVRGFSREL